MKLQARKKSLCSPHHPVPPTKGIILIANLAFINLYGVTAAFPPLIQKARISKSLLALGLCDDLFILTPSCLLSPMEARVEAVNISPFPRLVLYEKCHLDLNLVAKTKMQMYILKIILLKG